MAVISYYRPLADFDQSSWLGEVSGSSTRLTITDGYHQESFTGSFRFNYWGDAVTGGTLNGYSYSQDGTLFMSISGLSLSSVTVYNLYTSQRAAELLLLMHAGNDTVKGSQYADVLAGYEGNDSIYGYAGDDQLIGGNGNDLLDGGTGSDTLTGGLGDDIYVIDSLTDTIIENANEGTDQVRVAIATVGGSYSLGSNLENATLVNTVAFDLAGNELDNLLRGNAAANRIDGGLGADRMEGGAGDDTYVVDDIGDVIIDTSGIDTVETGLSYTLGNGLENLVITGSAAVSGTGNSLANVLDGSQNSAANELRGLGGNDTYIVDAGDTVIEEANGGIDLVKAAFSYTLGDNLENLTLLGSDDLSGTGNSLANVITGNDGNNTLDGGAGVDTLLGGKGDDTYTVDLTTRNALEDSVVENLNEGNDTILLRGGNAALTTVTAIALANNVENLDASDTGSTRLNLTGNALDNVITGNAANNVLNGGTGADTLIGGDGNDTYVVDNVGDVVTEQADQGIDLVQVAIATAGGTYTLGEHVENATLINRVAFNLTGNDLANTLIGNAANNVLDGGLGADVMNGGAGNDTYIVDDSGDVIIDSAGIDTVRASIAYTLGNGLENLELTGNQAISGTGNNLANILDGSQNAAANELRGLGGNDTYIVGAGDTVIEELNGGIDLVKAYVSYVLGDNLENLSLLGSDNLDATGNALANTLIGNDGNNILDGGAGVDTLLGGKGDDTYTVDLTTRNALEDSVVENLNEGNDTILLHGGNAALTTVTAIALANNVENLDASATGSSRLNLTGNALDNIITGNAANNVLNGGAGADTLIGGDGNDTYVVDNFGDVITEQADEGIDLVQVAIATAGGTYTLGEHVENATLVNKVAFNLTGNDLANTLIGNAANNVLDGGLGADTMNGGAGNDTYIVDDIGDVIIDSAGIDTVRASIAYTLGNGLENLELTGNQAISGTGNNLANVLDGSQNAAANELRGLGGNDTYIVGAGDTVIEEANGGIDLVKAYVSYVLGDNLENLSLLGSDNLDATGNALANVITGNDGNNILDGGAGVDTLLGGKGDDTYIVDLTSKNTLQDSITELAGEGNDTLVLRGGNDTLKASTLKLQLHLENLDASLTGSVQLHLTGNALDNILTGNDADNILSGEAGNDQLFGGDGNDILIGGIGADILSGGAGNDIFRFTALNHLGLGEGNQDVILDFVSGEDKLDFTALKGYSFKGDGAFDGTKQLRYERMDDDLMLYGNSGGDLNPDFSIKLLGVSQLQAGDLLLG